MSIDRSDDLIGRSQWAVLAAAFLGWMFDGLEMGLFPLAGKVALRDLLKPAVGTPADPATVELWFGAILAVFLVGAAAGGILFGWLGDRIGRVRAMSLSILTYSLFTGACYWATEAWHLGLLRLIASLGMGGEWALGVALVMECWPARLRPLLAGAIGAASNVGFLLIGLVSLGRTVTENDWRWIMLAGALPGFLTFFIQIVVPESEKWLAGSKAPDRSDPLREVFSPPLRRTMFIAIGLGGIALLGTWGSVQWMPNWAADAVLPKEASPSEKSNVRAWVQISSSFGAVVGCFVGSLLGGRIGRRPVYFGLCLASLLLCFLTFQGIHSYSRLVFAAAALVGATTAAFYGWLPLYLPELFPTRVRATGQGMAFNVGRVFAAAGVIGAGHLVNMFGSANAATLISCIYVAGMILIWYAPETHGRPLPE